MGLVTDHIERKDFAALLLEVDLVKKFRRYRDNDRRNFAGYAGQVQHLDTFIINGVQFPDKPIEVILRLYPRHEIISFIHLLVPQEADQSGQFSIVLSLDCLGLTGIRSRLIDFPSVDLCRIFPFQ